MASAIGGIVRISAANSGTTWTATATGVSNNLQNLVFDPDSPEKYFAAGQSAATIIKGIRTLVSQFQTPNDGANQWIRAVA
jgi:streptogramin lyase